MKSNPLSYVSSGVNYKTLDPIKVLAQHAAAKTNRSALFQEIPESRGESAYVWEESKAFRAFVMEGLGTKNLVADEMQNITGKTYYDSIAQDTVAMIVNDLIVVGAKPQVITAYFAVGDSEWFADISRASALINGWADACIQCGAVWGGGETPTLKGMVNPATIELAGSAVGIIQPKKRLTLGSALHHGDRIIVIESNGIHANGLTLARTIASTLPKGYKTTLPDGSMYGEALLKPTHLYASVVAALFEEGIPLHYMVNITGHGWRKLMRASQQFSYVIETVPDIPELFSFIQVHSNTTDSEMYGNFNMGAGFALFLPKRVSHKAQNIIAQHGYKSWDVGRVENGKKQVIIDSKHLTFSEDTLQVR